MSARSHLGTWFVLLVLAAACGGQTTPASTDGQGGSGATKGDPASAATPDSKTDSPSQIALPPRIELPPDTPPPDATDPVDFSGPILYWTEGSFVRAARLDGSGAVTIAAGPREQNFPIGITVDVAAKKVYWADNASDAITRANLDGSNPEELYRNTSDRFSNTAGIAVDHDAGRLFWTEQGGGTVKTAALDGSAPKTIYTGQFPTAVSVANGTLFFTENATDTMSRGDYAGGSPTVFSLTNDPFESPTAVTIDGDDVYWAQAGGIFKMKPDGTSRVQVATAEYPGGVAIDPTSRRIYFSDNADDTITYVEASGSGRTVVYKNKDAFSNPRGVAIRP